MNIITIDLHTHLNEKEVNPVDYWKRVMKIGLNAVAITEHNSCDPKGAFEKLNKNKPENIVLIPGMELNTSVGHTLVYAEDEKMYEEIEFYEDGVEIERVLEIVKEKGFYLSFAHPYGYEHDSICFMTGEIKAKKLIKKNQCGVEIYNGMISHLSNFLYDSQWVTKPFNFMSFLEKNLISRKIGLGIVGKKLKNSFDSKREDIIMRCIKSVELGNDSGFVTAGSDAHSADRIGLGIMKIKFEKELNPKNILESLKQKENIVWSGPLVEETEKGVYKKVEDPIKRKEIVQGLKYVTTKAVKKGRQKIPSEKIKSSITKKIKNIKIKEKIRNRIKQKINKN
jgi:histidinol phosphatase-like PHP family hydrolase